VAKKNKKMRQTILAIIIGVSVLFFVRSLMRMNGENGQGAANGNGGRMPVGANRRAAMQMVLQKTERQTTEPSRQVNMATDGNRMMALKARLQARRA